MVLRIIDFEKLTSHYINYQEGLSEIDKEKKEILKKLNPLKKEMNSIIEEAQSNLIIDDKTQQQKAKRFQELQNEAMLMDNDFKKRIKKINSELNEKCYDELSDIIKEWSIENNIDVVIGKMEVVFNKKQFESTEEILDILKDKKLFVEI